MKKYFKMMSLFLGLLVCTPAFVACGGDDDDNTDSDRQTTNNDDKKTDDQAKNDSASVSPQSNVSILGTWVCEHSGSFYGGGSEVNIETFTFKSDNTFESRYFSESKFENQGGSLEITQKGTYTCVEGTYEILLIVNEMIRKGSEAGENKTLKGLKDSLSIPFDRVAGTDNAFVFMSQYLDGLNFYVKLGTTLKLNYPNHELLGTWVRQERDTIEGKVYTTDFSYAFESNGKFTITEYEQKGPDGKQEGGRKLFGYYCVLNNMFNVKGIVGKFIALVDFEESFFNDETQSYSERSIRRGGHPGMTYLIRGNQLYIGHGAQSIDDMEEYTKQ